MTIKFLHIKYIGSLKFTQFLIFLTLIQLYIIIFHIRDYLFIIFEYTCN
jgi:hypothetical protein